METLGLLSVRALLASACAVMAGGVARGAEPASETGPTEVRARDVEFRRIDPDTGSISMAVSAARASASGESAVLETIRLVRYSPGGAPVLEASATGGRVLQGGSVALDGAVAVRWCGQKVKASFRSGPALWDNQKLVLSSEGPVRGTLAPGAGRPGEGGVAAFGLDIEGTGLEVTPERDRGRILSDVSAVMTGPARGPWRVTCDGGLEFSGLAGASPTLGFAGSVGVEGRGATIRADRAEVSLREIVDAREDEGDRAVAISRAWFVGTVCARVDGARDLPWAEGPVEMRAESAKIVPGGPDARATLTGTESDAARVIMPNGVLRGMRIEIAPGAVRTDGGARSELEWRGE